MFKYTREVSFAEENCHGKLLKYINEKDNVLEFGCSRGDFARYITEKFDCTVTGIEISAEALEVARPALTRAILCDIEEYAWVGELGDERFDVIVFADVIEHLKNPAQTLKEAKRFLKEGGRVIFSVPNVAHTDIVAKLFENRFDYTDIGLLDNTHVHLFAKENIASFCAEAGLFLAEISGTVAKAGTTEQGESFVDEYVKEFVKDKAYGNIYQFVALAYDLEYASKNGISFTDNIIARREIESKLFLDYGNGYSYDDAIVFKTPYGERIVIDLDIPSGVKKIRVTFKEQGRYFLNNVKLLIDGKAAQIINQKSIVHANGTYMTVSSDAWFLLEVNGEAKKLHCEADVLPIYANEALDGILTDHFDYVGDVEKKYVFAAKQHTETEKELDECKRECEKIIEKQTETEKELEEYKRHYKMAIEQRNALSAQRNTLIAERQNLQAMYDNISNAACWKMTKPLRFTLDLIKKIIKKIPPLYKVARGIKCLKQNGFKYTVNRIKQKIRNKKRAEALSAAQYTPEELERQKGEKFEKDIKFSILVPLYNTPEKYLTAMIDSVIVQTYSNLELCLADGSDSEHSYVNDIVRKYQKKDKRIKYKKLEKNMGISGNTNACIDMSEGDYIVLFDHDDLLHPAALYEVMHAICDEGADFIYTDENTFSDTPADAYFAHFKPDFSPDTLRSYNYICHLSVFSRELLEKAGHFRSEFDGSQDYDIILRLTEKAEKIVHIPKVLYYWRAHANSVASDISAKPYTLDAARRALNEHLKRLGLDGCAVDSRIPSTYKIEYAIKGEPKVSIIIPNKDHIDDLDKCINSIKLISTYKNYEIIIVENNSDEPETFAYYEKIKEELDFVKVVVWEDYFNYSKINNFGVKSATGEYYILLNNDIEILTPSWIEEMLMFSQRDDVGAVGMMLYYPDNTVQHAGVIIGIGGVAGHAHKYFNRGDYGYASRLSIAQNFSAVTAAALMVRRDVWDNVGGLDEDFAVAFNDVDFCMKIRDAGYLIVWTPYAEAYHYESKSRGLEDTVEKQKRFRGECDKFFAKWQKELDAGDPYYNPNLTLEREDFTVR